MGGVPTKHHTSSKTRRRRSHLGLKLEQIFACQNCQAPVLPHRYCAHCGNYKGRIIKEPKLKIRK